MDLINILTLYRLLFINYINSNIYILIDKCLLVSGYTLTTSSYKVTVGLDFTFTCVTTDTAMSFISDVTAVSTITGSNTDGVFTGSYITDYTYTCNPTTNTYTVTIPGSYLTESLHGTEWRYQNPFGGEHQMLRYFMVSYFSFYFLVCNYSSSKYNNSPAST